MQVLKDSYELAVCDEGSGISEDVLPLIFDKFYHVSKSSKGLGLGLAIVKAVVDIHKGKIEVRRNQEEQGTEFSLILPL